MRHRWILWFLLLAFALTSTQVFAESDSICGKCKGRPREPWCYQEEVERIGDPDLCANILKYWPRADGVHGWCFYRLALKQKECSLCDSIHKEDIRKRCIMEVCKPGN